ncbi:LAMI_0C09846g1_1 [Lachancea mirantina]|uniref:Transcription initiation factor IIA large subunit n=1 Tax=Lachancea mirantina TaxID=1230905 RepID=A0A1G4J5G1_9SACH|nr:LAMI_0C09846g1_1 [Lachancea mirantina]
MSNLEAAGVYERVVENVINEVREDFESAGIDEQTLQDLKAVWQAKLSDSRAARFMWDPEEAGGLNGQLQHSASISQSVMDPHGLSLPTLSPEDVKTDLSQQHTGPMTQTKHEEGDEKQEIELTTEDPDGQIAEQLKLQAKQAKKSALLETDEINSDLDDSEDDYLNSSGEEEGQDENIVLCLYEKVLRVKNKWKCNLKDGLATINHKDYAFQKAQGETEW